MRRFIKRASELDPGIVNQTDELVGSCMEDLALEDIVLLQRLANALSEAREHRQG
jgi:hypothetical protein